MSQSDHVDGKRGTALIGQGAADRARTEPAAMPDLRDILTQIASQIAEVDRRHSDAMRDMHGRLANLSGEAHRAKTELAPELTPAIERIETRMARLASRVAVAEEPVAPAPASARVTAPVLIAKDENTDHWDALSAEALTQLYESGAAGPADEPAGLPLPKSPPAFFVDPPVTGGVIRPSPVRVDASVVRPRLPAAEPARQAGPAGIVPVSAPATLPAHSAVSLAASARVAEGPSLLSLAGDREWLDERLCDIAIRVEQSLAQLKPDNALGMLTERLDAFETRFGLALEGVAQRSDVEGLRLVEAHITELTAHVDATERQLGRLDAIEAQLRDLTHYAETARAEAEAIAEAPAPDYDALMAGAAAKAAERFATMPQAVVQQNQRVDSLHVLMQEFIAERRREDQQTAGMLDTMQEALVRLIDRIEEVDAGHVPGGVYGGLEPHAVEHAPVPAAVEAEEPALAFGRRAAEAAAVAAGAAARAGVRAESLAPAVQDEVAAVAAVAPSEPVERRDLDAAALRARARASVARQAADVTADDGAAAAATPAEPKRPRPSTQPSSRAPGAARRGLMVAGLAVVLIGMSTFAHLYLADRFGLAGPKLDGRLPPIAATPTAMQPPVAVRGTIEPAAATDVAPPELRGQMPARDEKRQGPVPREPADSGRAKGSELVPSSPPPRTIPETVTEDLSQNAAQPARPGAAPAGGNDAMAAAVTLAGGSYQGIALAQSQMPLNPLELQRLQQRQQLANTSTRLGVQGALPQVMATASSLAIPVAATPDTRAAAVPVPADSIMADAPTGAVELPPALIGPLSFRLAAQRGDPSAEFEVAARFAEAKGVKQDFKQAMIWYQRAAQKGFAPAQYRLATLYERGLGTKPDMQRARVWYKRAAEQGNVKAMHNLAVLSAGRESGAPDYTAASQWFTEAAERGLADSQFNLAVLCENGLGVPKDALQAYKWFTLAAKSGDKEAVRRRDQMIARFDVNEVKSGEDLVAAWRPRPVDLKANDARIAGEAWRVRAEQAAEAQSQPPAPVGAPPAPTGVAATMPAGAPPLAGPALGQPPRPATR